jgi:hypothetical protein
MVLPAMRSIVGGRAQGSAGAAENQDSASAAENRASHHERLRHRFTPKT